MASSLACARSERGNGQKVRVLACELAIELEHALVAENIRDNEIIVNLVNRIHRRKEKIEEARRVAQSLNKSGRAA